MNEKSEFQKANPLSKKKFIKKFISGSTGGCIILATLAISLGFIAWGLSLTGDAAYSIVLIGTLAILAFGALYLAINAFYISLYIKLYYYDCGDDFITIKKGVLTPREIHVQYQKIQDVYVDQDLLDRIFGIYDVHIASATVTSGVEAHIDGVDFEVAESIKNFLLKKIQHGGRSVNDSAPQATRKPLKVNLKEEISSKTYPISNKWIVSQIITSMISSFILVFVFGLWFAAKTEIEFLIFLIFGIVVFVILVIGNIIWTLIWKANYFFEFTPDFILLKTGVISRQENHMPYSSIQDVAISQGFVERIIGIATLKISNASQIVQKSRNGNTTVSGGVMLVGQTPENAAKINKVLSDVVAKQNPSGTGL